MLATMLALFWFDGHVVFLSFSVHNQQAMLHCCYASLGVNVVPMQWDGFAIQWTLWCVGAAAFFHRCWQMCRYLRNSRSRFERELYCDRPQFATI